jgi:hypothetical protein
LYAGSSGCPDNIDTTDKLAPFACIVDRKGAIILCTPLFSLCNISSQRAFLGTSDIFYMKMRAIPSFGACCRAIG